MPSIEFLYHIHYPLHYTLYIVQHFCHPVHLGHIGPYGTGVLGKECCSVTELRYQLFLFLRYEGPLRIPEFVNGVFEVCHILIGAFLDKSFLVQISKCSSNLFQSPVSVCRRYHLFFQCFYLFPYLEGQSVQ